MFPLLSRCQQSGHTARRPEVTTGNFSFDQLIDAYGTLHQLSSKQEIEDTDMAGERFPGGLRSSVCGI